MSKCIIFLVKSFLGNFYRHLAIFSGHTGCWWSLYGLRIDARWHFDFCRTEFLASTMSRGTTRRKTSGQKWPPWWRGGWVWQWPYLEATFMPSEAPTDNVLSIRLNVMILGKTAGPWWPRCRRDESTSVVPCTITWSTPVSPNKRRKVIDIILI